MFTNSKVTFTGVHGTEHQIFFLFVQLMFIECKLMFVCGPEGQSFFLFWMHGCLEDGQRGFRESLWSSPRSSPLWAPSSWISLSSSFLLLSFSLGRLFSFSLFILWGDEEGKVEGGWRVDGGKRWEREGGWRWDVGEGRWMKGGWRVDGGRMKDGGWMESGWRVGGRWM
jgi:hypothetical protein